METAEVNAAITGADMKFVRNPEDEITNKNVNCHISCLSLFIDSLCF